MDFLRGIAMDSNMYFDVILGIIVYMDTKYKSKGKYTKKYLKDHKFVLLNVNATDEEPHQHNLKGKIEVIEKIDDLGLRSITNELYNI